MPTYHYRCPNGHSWDKLQKMTDRRRVRCPQCGKLGERQITGGAGLVFKGSGFYITDYGKSGRKPAGEAAGGDKSESKPAKKEDKKESKKDSAGADT